MKRIFNGTVKCGFCGKDLTADEICEYIPFDKREGDIDEEQCPYCGYHNDCVDDPYQIVMMMAVLIPAGRRIRNSLKK